MILVAIVVGVLSMSVRHKEEAGPIEAGPCDHEDGYVNSCRDGNAVLQPDEWMNEIWMDAIEDDVSVGGMALPGTVYSGGFSYPRGRGNQAKLTQSMNFQNQLKSGVRAFHLVAEVGGDSNDPLLLVGADGEAFEATVGNAFHIFASFLHQKQSECLVVFLESLPSSRPERGLTWHQAVKKYLKRPAHADVDIPFEHFVLRKSLDAPQLGDCRGKLVLLGNNWPEPTAQDQMGHDPYPRELMTADASKLYTAGNADLEAPARSVDKAIKNHVKDVAPKFWGKGAWTVNFNYANTFPSPLDAAERLNQVAVEAVEAGRRQGSSIKGIQLFAFPGERLLKNIMGENKDIDFGSITWGSTSHQRYQKALEPYQSTNEINEDDKEEKARAHEKHRAHRMSADEELGASLVDTDNEEMAGKVAVMMASPFLVVLGACACLCVQDKHAACEFFLMFLCMGAKRRRRTRRKWCGSKGKGGGSSSGSSRGSRSSRSRGRSRKSRRDKGSENWY